MTDPVLSLSNVTRRFDNHVAVSDLSLSVGKGERVALLGHNGAGKTTLMKMILGLIPVTSGAISLFGLSPGTDEARRRTAFLPENVSFQKALTAREYLTLFARLKGENVRKAHDLLDLVDLAAAADRRVGTYSKGMRQRLGLAQALIGQPDLLLLDEPTSGLDPVSRRGFYTIIEAIAREGTAVLLSSHALTEIEAQTDRVAIMRAGCLMADSPIQELRRASNLPVRIRVRAVEGTVDALNEQIGGERVNCQSIELTCLSENKLRTLGDLSRHQHMIEDLDIRLPNLDDIYRHFSLDDSKSGGMS
ncbi:ABC transporter ATP-binding protein [Coralliovum pocilloporae]|uniref:ABC transporter ATP-binding protein n=1 Tax=Coralliovum pocilloporae TaxID=3066369 RepID=UPI003307255D